MLSSVMRDRNNNMWVASYNGLYKHEGSRIRAFNKIGADDRSLSGSEIHALFEDRDGNIWAGTANGVDKIHPLTYAIQHYPLRVGNGSGNFVGAVYCIFQDKEDCIWISTEAGLFKLNAANGDYITVPMQQDGAGVPSFLLSYKSAITTEAGVWMYTKEGLVFYDYSAKRFFHRYHNPKRLPVFNLKGSGWGNQSDLRLDENKNLWFVSDTAHLVRYNVSTQQLDSFAYTRPNGSWRCCYSLAIDYKGRVWLGFRYGGIQVFDPAVQEFRTINTATAGRLIHSNYVWSLEEDYQGRMWVSTHNGLDIIDLDNKAVRRLYLTNDDNFRSRAYEMVTPTTYGDSILFLPFYRLGFLRVNLRTDSIDQFRLTADYPSGTTYIIPRNANTVWAGRDRHMLSYDLQKKIPVPPFRNNPLGDSTLTPLGDVIWHYKTDTSLLYRTDEGDIFYRTTSGHRFRGKGYGGRQNICLAPGKQCFWYVDDSLNLVQYDLTTNVRRTIVLAQMLKPLNFSFADPRSILDDGDAIWLTGRNGLLRYRHRLDKLSAYTVANGLAQNFTFSLCVDARQNLWVGSLGGVDVYNPRKDFFQNVIAHPTESLMDAFGQALPLGDHLCFISGNKVFLIDPEKALAQKTDIVYKLLLQEMVVNGLAVDWNNSDLHQLRYTENSFVFRFGLLDYIKLTGAKYYYYLEGLDDTWIENRVPGEVSYGLLSPGNYVFHVKAVDATGKAVSGEINLPFEIQPPFWKRWWFGALLLLLLFIIGYHFYKRRVNKIKKEAAIRQQLTELESKALRAQMNPHFIFNSLNAIQELVVTKDVDAAYDYLSRFSKLLRQVLNNSEKSLIPLSDELSMLRLYLELESLRFRSAFTYHIGLHPRLDVENLLVPPLLLQPFIENALWHGLMLKEGEKRLHINVAAEGSQLVCSIRDNGIGRKKAQEIKAQKIGAAHLQSKGMELSKHRLALLQQSGVSTSIQIEDLYEDNTPSGTSVRITVPLHYT